PPSPVPAGTGRLSLRRLRCLERFAVKTQQERLAAQSRALADLTARQTDDAVPYLERLHAILATSAETLDVARLSMWWFDMPRLSIRSEEHTSELQSRENLVCRLLLEK